MTHAENAAAWFNDYVENEKMAAKFPLTQRIAELEQQVTAAQAEAARLTAEAEDHSTQIATLTALVAELRAHIAELEAVTPPDVEPSPGLFFKRADYDGPKKVFAHYFTPYPRSWANEPERAKDQYARYYTNPTYAPYVDSAGWHEDRPIYRAPVGGNWLVEDCKFDIRTAQAHGIDGFVVDLLGMSGANYDRSKALVQAAEELDSGFLVAPMLDGNGAHSVTGGDQSKPVPPADAARAIASVYWGKKSTFTIDGAFVVTSFKGEARDVAWWTALFDALRTNHDVPKVAFHMGVLDWGKIGNYSAITAGEGNWGDGDDPATIAKARNKAAESRSRGKAHMQPVGGGQIRRHSGYLGGAAVGVFDETLNTEGLRAHWAKVIRDQPDHVQLVTWSDYSEGAAHAPTEARGYSQLILDAYYSDWWRTGQAPTILRDEIIVSHRESRRDATPARSQTRRLVQWAGGIAGRGGPFSPVRDGVEVLTFLTDPDTVTVTIGGQTHRYDAPAGEHTKVLPMDSGAVKVTTGRGTTVTSPIAITDRPGRENAVYYAASAIRGTDGQRITYT